MKHGTSLASLLGLLTVLLGACGGASPSAPSLGSGAPVLRDSGPGEERKGEGQDLRRPREGRSGR